MPQPIQVRSCDDCPLKILGDDGVEWWCTHGSVDVDSDDPPEDCDLRNGDVIVRLKVRR